VCFDKWRLILFVILEGKIQPRSVIEYFAVLNRDIELEDFCHPKVFE